MLHDSVWLGGLPLKAHAEPLWLANDQLTPEPAGRGSWSETLVSAPDVGSLTVTAKPTGCPGLTWVASATTVRAKPAPPPFAALAAVVKTGATIEVIARIAESDRLAPTSLAKSVHAFLASA